jgi:proteasome activator subunit 4
VIGADGIELENRQDSTRDFPDWIANFIRRVIQLLENLPDEDQNGNTEETTESQSLWLRFGGVQELTAHCRPSCQCSHGSL